MTAEEKKAREFMLAHGGPFYELQRRLGLLREDAFRAGSRALLFVREEGFYLLKFTNEQKEPVKVTRNINLTKRKIRQDAQQHEN